MYTEYWASVDQSTSYLKDPWKFDRPENKKQDCLLSQHKSLNSKQWPNTTSDFTWTYKDTTKAPSTGLHRSQNSSRLMTATPTQKSYRRGTPTPSTQLNRSPSPSSQKSQNSSRLITATPTQRSDRRVTPFSSSSQNFRSTKEPLPLDASGYMVSSQNSFGSSNFEDSKPRSALYTSRGLHTRSSPVLTPPREEKKHFPNTKSMYSTAKIGVISQQAPRVNLINAKNRENYVAAAKDTSQSGDIICGAETHHFRHKYPHTLGKLKAYAKQKSNPY